MNKPHKGNWVVRMRCTVTKLVTCEDCTEEEARNNPFDHAVDEMEIDQVDWDVQSVTEDK
jgi:hypothetical protein